MVSPGPSGVPNLIRNLQAFTPKMFGGILCNFPIIQFQHELRRIVYYCNYFGLLYNISARLLVGLLQPIAESATSGVLGAPKVVAPKLVGDHPLSCNPGAGDELVPRESLAGWWFQRCFIEIWRAKAEAMDSLRVSMNYKHVSSFLVQILMS